MTQTRIGLLYKVIYITTLLCVR